MTAARPLPVRSLPLLLFGALALLLVGVEYAIVGRADFGRRPALPYGVAADLILVLPALFYLLVMRPYKLPLSLLLAMAGAGLALSQWLLPAGPSGSVLTGAGWAAAGLEVATLAYAAVRARRIVGYYRVAQLQSADFLDNLHLACQPVLGRLTEGLVTELAVLRYALLGAGASVEISADEQAFSTYRDTALTATLATVGGLVVLESAAAHLVVGHWFPRLAWWLTVLSAYSLLWLLAHGRAVRRRPVALSAAVLTVRVGLVWRVRILRSEVLRIERLRDAPLAAPDLFNTARQLFTTPNLLLTLATPHLVRGPYGLQRTVRQLAIYVDEPAALQQALSATPQS